jgi:hypothetical protein
LSPSLQVGKESLDVSGWGYFRGTWNRDSFANFGEEGIAENSPFDDRLWDDFLFLGRFSGIFRSTD